MNPEADAVITGLQMSPIPLEGGWFRETWRSETVVPLPGRDGRSVDKPAGTAILALFCDAADGFSALHRLPTTEVWHFCGGDPFRLLLLHPDRTSEEVVLGPDVATGHAAQVPVPGGTWMGGDVLPGGRYALVGCTMAPGFTSDDFEAGRADDLVATYPDRADRIRGLTRS